MEAGTVEFKILATDLYSEELDSADEAFKELGKTSSDTEKEITKSTKGGQASVEKFSVNTQAYLQKAEQSFQSIGAESERIANNLGNLENVSGEISNTLSDISASVGDAGSGVSGLADGFGSLAGASGEAKGGILGLTSGFRGLGMAAKATGILAVVSALLKLKEYFDDNPDQLEKYEKEFKKSFDSIENTVEIFKGAFSSIEINASVSGLDISGEIKSQMQRNADAVQGSSSLFKNALSFFDSFDLSGFTNQFKGLSDSSREIDWMGTAVSSLTASLRLALRTATNTVEGIVTQFKLLGGFARDYGPKLAEGFKLLGEGDLDGLKLWVKESKGLFDEYLVNATNAAKKTLSNQSDIVVGTLGNLVVTKEKQRELLDEGTEDRKKAGKDAVQIVQETSEKIGSIAQKQQERQLAIYEKTQEQTLKIIQDQIAREEKEFEDFFKFAATTSELALKTFFDAAEKEAKAFEAAIERANDQIANQEKEWQKLGDSGSGVEGFLNKLSSKFSSGLEGILGGASKTLGASVPGLVGGITEVVGKLVDKAVQVMRDNFQKKMNSLQKTTNFINLALDVQMNQLEEAWAKEAKEFEKFQNMEKESFEARQKAELEAFNASQNAQLSLLRKNSAEKLALYDQEFASQQEILRQQLEATLLLIQTEKDARLLANEENAVTQSERVLNQSTIEQNARDQAKDAQEQYEKEVQSLVNKTNNKKKEETDQVKEKEDAIRSQTSAAEKAFIDKQEKESKAFEERQLVLKEQFEEKQTAAKKKAAKERAAVDYAAALIEFRLMQQMRVQEATLSYAMGVMNAVTSSMQYGLFGLIIAPMLIALETWAYGSALSVISSTPPPLPPADLFARDGGMVDNRQGVLAGSEHVNGGTSVTAQRGEMFLNRETSDQVGEFFSEKNKQRREAPIFGERSIVVYGRMDEEMIDIILERAAQKMNLGVS